MRVADLTLREKIGQTVITLCVPEEHIKKMGSIESFVKKYPIGGIYNSARLTKGMLSDELSNFKDVLAEYNKYSKIPLFATADMESGTSEHGMVLFPRQMVLGAIDDEELAYEYGRVIASEAGECGINWMFAPNCDLSIVENSVTDTRAISGYVPTNLKLLKKIIRGIEDAGIISTAKHYPGSSINEIDSHIAPNSNKITMKFWNKTNRVLYQGLIDSGVSSIMSSHQNLPCYQKEKTNGKYPPATLSRELITGLLRGELGFNGVVVTDALVMGGFTGAGGLQNMIECFKAGNDILLWPSLEYIDEMERRILSGEISEELLDRAVTRILDLKERFGIMSGKADNVKYDKRQAEDLLQRISERCLTLVQNKNKVLPMGKMKRVLIVGVTPNDEDYEALTRLKTEFEKCGVKAHIQRDIWQDELESVSKDYDLILFALCRQVHKPIGPLDFWAENAASVWTSNCSDPKKTAVVSFGTPAHYKYYKETGITYVNAYSPNEAVIRAFVRAVLGEIEFCGKSPVKL